MIPCRCYLAIVVFFFLIAALYPESCLDIAKDSHFLDIWGMTLLLRVEYLVKVILPRTERIKKNSNEVLTRNMAVFKLRR